LCPSTKGQRPDPKNGERAEREGRVDRLGWPLGRFCKEGKKKEEEVVNFAEIRLNFEKFKVWSKWW
jgi:hypothetical protein